jgi:hypothetical protein
MASKTKQPYVPASFLVIQVDDDGDYVDTMDQVDNQVTAEKFARNYAMEDEDGSWSYAVLELKSVFKAVPVKVNVEQLY